MKFSVSAATSLLIAFCLISSAMAFSDKKSGLAIDAPKPFSARVVDNPKGTITLAIESTTGKPSKGGMRPALCILGYIAKPDYAQMTQKYLNTAIKSADYRTRLKKHVEDDLGFKVLKLTGFKQGAFEGVELQLQPRDGTGLPDDRAIYSYFVTPKGETELDCFGVESELKEALPMFRALRASIVPAH